MFCKETVAAYHRSNHCEWSFRTKSGWARREDQNHFGFTGSRYSDVCIPYLRHISITPISKSGPDSSRPSTHPCHILECLVDIAKRYQLEWSLTEMKSVVLEISKQKKNETASYHATTRLLQEEQILLLATVDRFFPDIVDAYVNNIESELQGRRIWLLGELASNLSQPTLAKLMQWMGKHCVSSN